MAGDEAVAAGYVRNEGTNQSPEPKNGTRGDRHFKFKFLRVNDIFSGN